MKLKFSFGNAKLPKYIATFSLPAAWSCPGAKLCQSFANPITGKIVDGKNIQFRCYAASQEALFPTTRAARWHNFELLKGKSKAEMVQLIQESLPECIILRIGVSGDFFSQNYFDAWLTVIKNNPHIKFYAYTKSINFWIKRLKEIPANFILNASYGGKFDGLIKKHGLKSVKVVDSEQHAADLGLEIDHTDKIAYTGDKSFALLLHGMGPKGSLQAKLKHKYGYSEK